MLLSFINRKNELAALEERYKSDRAEFFVIYGRRRIGKTELVKQFLESKEYLYFLAKEEDIRIEIERFREKFSEKFNIRIEKTLDLEKIFNEAISKLELKKKIVIVIDEFPYWISKHRQIVSEFQYLWDEILSKHNIFLILMGSSVSIIENEILSHKSPLFGRRTGQIKLGSISLNYLKEFIPEYGIEDLFKVYAAVGTVPLYLREFDGKKGYLENIKNTFLNKSSILHEEAESLLRQELREVNAYFNILRAIQEGAAKLSEIASKSMVDITNINKYLATLIRLELVKKEFCITLPAKSRNFAYKIADNYFSFWLRYVYPYEDEIEENAESVLKIIQDDLERYMGLIFEDICIKFLRLSGKANYPKIGRWWHKGEEIDIVALNDKERRILFAECKWQDNVNAEKILEELKEKSKYVEWSNESRKEEFVVFAKSFSKKAKNCYDLKDLEKMFLK